MARRVIDEAQERRLRAILLGATLVLFLCAAVVFDATGWFRALLGGLDPDGAGAPLLFFALYVLSCVLLLPGFILTAGAGAVFGVVKGSLLVCASATAGALAAFLIGRHLARDWVRAKLEGHPRLLALDAGVEQEGWKIVALARLVPFIPFRLSNYAFGLTKVPALHFTAATVIGTLPSASVYVYTGSLLGSIGELTPENLYRAPGWPLKLGVLCACVVFLWFINRFAKRAYRQFEESAKKADARAS